MSKINFAAWLIFLFLTGSAADAADIKIFADEPLQFALVKIGAAFQTETGHKVDFVFAPSPVIARRVSLGETADVLIMQPSFVAAMTKDGKLTTGEHPVFTRVGFGVGMRTQSPSADVSSPEALKQALLKADSLVCSNRASGDHFVKVIESLGLTEATKAKLARLEPPDVFARVLQGSGNDIAVGTSTQIKGTPGLKLVGALPGDLQSNIPYAAAATTSTAAMDAANAFVGYVSSAKAKAEFVAAGGE